MLLFDLRPIFMIIGLATTTLGVAMLLPAFVDLYFDNPDWIVFVTSSMFTIFVGVAMWASARAPTVRFSLRQAFLLTALTWVVLSAFAALPLAFGEIGLSLDQAFFEAMSGLTTTGATVMTNLDGAPPGILIWRSIMQWIGGVGIIGIAIAVLPALQIGGMQLFRTESAERSDKAFPRAGQTAGWILGIYVMLTLACALAYSLAGMGTFDAIAHGMTTIATGGFSTKNASIGHFDSAAIELVCIGFMILGSLPFLLYFRAVRGNWRALIDDPQVRLFLAIILLFWLIGFTNAALTGIAEGAEGLRLTLFNTVTLLSTSGFAAVDYTYWGAFNDMILFLLCFLGGCTGSTAGGLKMLRLHVVWAALTQHSKRIAYPSSVFPMRYGTQPLGDDVASAVLSFFFVYFAGFFAVAMAFDILGTTEVSALSASVALFGNIGPGLGPEIGPAGNYSSFTSPELWLAYFAMLLGRLELFTVLVLFHPRFWRG
ncbi:MAG: TrkH family potassium uptake protein [Pseudomonadota bacterium]